MIRFRVDGGVDGGVGNARDVVIRKITYDLVKNHFAAKVDHLKQVRSSLPRACGAARTFHSCVLLAVHTPSACTSSLGELNLPLCNLFMLFSFVFKSKAMDAEKTKKRKEPGGAPNTKNGMSVWSRQG